VCLLVAGSLTWQRDCARNEHWKHSAWTLQSGEVCLFLAVMLVFLAVLISSDPQVKLERVLYSDGLKFIRWLHDSECTVTLWFAFKLSSLHSTSEATWAHHGLRSSPWWPSVTWISSVFPHPWLAFYLGPATIHLYTILTHQAFLEKGSNSDIGPYFHHLYVTLLCMWTDRHKENISCLHFLRDHALQIGWDHRPNWLWSGESIVLDFPPC